MGAGEQEAPGPRTAPALTVDTILRALPAFSASDRSKIMAALLELRTSTKEKDPSVLDLVHAALCAELTARGAAVRPLAALRRTTSYGTFSDGAKAVHAYVTDHMAPANRGELIKGLRLVMRTMLSTMDKKGWEVGLMSAALTLPRAPGMVDRAFPGYREARLLPCLLRAVRQ